MGKLMEAFTDEKRALNKTMIFLNGAPPAVYSSPVLFLRALRGTLLMSQAVLAQRSGIPRSHIAAIESGAIDPQLSTLKRLFDAMYCDMLILPKPRRRPTDVIGERIVEHGRRWPWGRPRDSAA